MIFPIGAFEQHGPAATLGTDYYIASYLAEQISERTNIMYIPCLPFGYSVIHSNFPGTISLSKKLYFDIINSIITELEKNNVSKIIIINGHGGNIRPIKRIIEHSNICFLQWFELIGNKYFENEHKSHAGSEELSLLAAIKSEYVDEEKIENRDPSKMNIVWKELQPEERKTEYYTENGVYCYADKYSKELGQRILADVVDIMVEKINIFLNA